MKGTDTKLRTTPIACPVVRSAPPRIARPAAVPLSRTSTAAATSTSAWGGVGAVNAAPSDAESVVIAPAHPGASASLAQPDIGPFRPSPGRPAAVRHLLADKRTGRRP